MKRWDPFFRSEVQPKEGVLYANNRYHVIVHRHKNKVEGGPDMWHLSIRNNDRSAKRDWRDFQRIKNEFLGTHFEAVEIYPDEKNLADSANQYHLWAFVQPNWLSSLGLGYTEGRFVWDGVSDPPPGFDTKVLKTARQRPIKADKEKPRKEKTVDDQSGPSDYALLADFILHGSKNPTEQEKYQAISDFLQAEGWQPETRRINSAIADIAFRRLGREDFYITLGLNAAGTMMPAKCGWMICTTKWNGIKSLGGDLESLKRGMKIWRL